MSKWVDAAEVLSRLQEEAMFAATRLGHRMTSWIAAPGERGLFLARCVACSDHAQVSVRNPHRSPIGGAAVELRCPTKGKHSPGLAQGATTSVAK